MKSKSPESFRELPQTASLKYGKFLENLCLLPKTSSSFQGSKVITRPASNKLTQINMNLLNKNWFSE